MTWLTFDRTELSWSGMVQQAREVYMRLPVMLSLSSVIIVLGLAPQVLAEKVASRGGPENKVISSSRPPLEIEKKSRRHHRKKRRFLPLSSASVTAEDSVKRSSEPQDDLLGAFPEVKNESDPAALLHRHAERTE